MLAAVIEMFAVVLPTQQDRYTALESVDSRLDTQPATQIVE